MMCYNDWGHVIVFFSFSRYNFMVSRWQLGGVSWLLPLLFCLPLQVGIMLPKHALRVAKDPSAALSVRFVLHLFPSKGAVAIARLHSGHGHGSTDFGSRIM